MSRTKLVRMDKDIEKKLRDIMEDRYQKRLSKIKEISVPEALRLQFKCPSWGKVEQELRSLPKNRKNGN